MVVCKGDGNIRVCVDMRRANEAIIRERHPIPTVGELLHDLNGSTVFSKIDLKWGFHQILLSEDSQHITTFVTVKSLSLEAADVRSDVGTGQIPANCQRLC